MNDERALRDKARSLIKAGVIPKRRPDRVWGGPGVGADCTICRAPLGRGESELEIEFVRDGDGSEPDRYHLHIHCFAAWELEVNLSPSRSRLPKGNETRSRGAGS